jgi:hypothetical protein
MRCECQNKGTVHSGAKGILTGAPDKTGRRYIERCDACELFHSDEAAGLEYARIKGGGCAYNAQQRVVWRHAR